LSSSERQATLGGQRYRKLFASSRKTAKQSPGREDSAHFSLYNVIDFCDCRRRCGCVRPSRIRDNLDEGQRKLLELSSSRL